MSQEHPILAVQCRDCGYDKISLEGREQPFEVQMSMQDATRLLNALQCPQCGGAFTYRIVQE